MNKLNRNSKGQFASKRKLIFNTLLILSMIVLYCGYAKSVSSTETYLDLTGSLVSPISYDSLLGIDGFSDNLDKVENGEYWYKPPTVEEKRIAKLENELQTRYEDMTIEQKIKHVFGEDGEDAIKVASCESGLNPKAKNKNSSARGLFQILSQLHQVKEQWLYDEDVNISIAKQMFDASGWNPWRASNHCHQLLD